MSDSNTEVSDDLYGDPVTCFREGDHLKYTDDDGYCNACGHQEHAPLKYADSRYAFGVSAIDDDMDDHEWAKTYGPDPDPKENP